VPVLDRVAGPGQDEADVLAAVDDAAGLRNPPLLAGTKASTKAPPDSS
jgi:hypothetical protein